MRKRNYKNFQIQWKKYLNDFPIKILDFTDKQSTKLIKNFSNNCILIKDKKYLFKDGLYIGDYISGLQYTFRVIKENFKIIEIEEESTIYYVISDSFNEFYKNHLEKNTKFINNNKYLNIKSLLYNMINDFDLSDNYISDFLK